MERLYRVTVVNWVSNYDSDTDYYKDFDNEGEAIEYVEKHKQDILKEYQDEWRLDDLFTLDIDVEFWDENDNIYIVYSTKVYKE